MLRYCRILPKACVFSPAPWFCSDLWSCACLYYEINFENRVYSCIFQQLGFSAEKSDLHMCFLCCIMWMTHNGAFIIHPLSTLLCFLKQHNNMIWTWLSTLILILMQMVKGVFDFLRRYQSGVNQLRDCLKEMLMQMTLHQHRLEGQVLKPVRLWILEFLDRQLGMLVFAFQNQSRRSERAHYDDGWASLKYFRLGFLNH